MFLKEKPNISSSRFTKNPKGRTCTNDPQGISYSGPKAFTEAALHIHLGDSFLTDNDLVTVKLYPPVQGALEH